MFTLSFLRKKAGFTLVELLVVITILALLALVSFVVFSQQSSQARDTSRIATIRNLHDGARMAVAQVRDLPLPENPVVLSVSGTQIGWQGYVGSDLASFVNYSNTILDPVDGDPYTYRLSQTRDRSQFLVHLENGFTDHELNLVNSSHLPFSRAYAYVDDLSDRYPYAWGDRLGIVLDHDNNLPVQNSNVASGGSGVAIDLASTGASSLYRIAVNENIKICSLTGALLDAVASSSGLDDRIASSILSESDVIGCGIAYANEGGSGVSPDTPSLALSPGNSQISVSWSLSSGATSYTLAYALSPSGSYTEIPNLTSTGYVHTGLTNGSTYYYKVKAVGASGESVYSSVVSAMPPIINYAGQVSVGPHHACAVKFDGTLACWHDGTALSATNVPIGVNNVVQVVALDGSTCVLKEDGSTQCWGSNSLGQTNIPKLALRNIVHITAYNYGVCAQRYDDLLICWGHTGDNAYLAHANTPNYLQAAIGYGSICLITTSLGVECFGYNSSNFSYIAPLISVPGSLSGVQDLSVSDRSACALHTDASITCWGDNTNGQINVPDLPAIKQVHVGGTSDCVVTNTGGVLCWGANASLLNNYVGSMTGVIALSQYDSNICVMRTNGGINCRSVTGTNGNWIENNLPSDLHSNNASGNASTVLDNTVQNDAQISAIKIANAPYHACVVQNSGNVACWHGGSAAAAINVPLDLTGALDIAVSTFTSCALRGDGTTKCWGDSSWTPEVIAAFTGKTFVQLSARHVNFCGIQTNDIPVCSRYGTYSTGATMITSGAYHSCIIRKSDNTVQCSGDSSNGKLNIPSGLTNVIDIAAGDEHTCALRASGSVVCWGRNNYGQINVPIGLDSVVQISMGEYNSCALKSDNIMVCWGRVFDLNYGINVYPPVGLKNISDFVIGGDNNFCAIQTNGTIVCNQNGWSSWLSSGVPSN